MRSESEISEAVLGYAEVDDAVRAVIRTDLLPVREYLYSYQFCFIVNDIVKYDDDSIFEGCFGERILLFRGDKTTPRCSPTRKRI